MFIFPWSLEYNSHHPLQLRFKWLKRPLSVLQDYYIMLCCYYTAQYTIGAKAWWIQSVNTMSIPHRAQDARVSSRRAVLWRPCTPGNGQLCDNQNSPSSTLFCSVSMMMSSRDRDTPSGDRDHREEEFWWGVWSWDRKTWRMGLLRGNRGRDPETLKIYTAGQARRQAQTW